MTTNDKKSDIPVSDEHKIKELFVLIEMLTKRVDDLENELMEEKRRLAKPPYA